MNPLLHLRQEWLAWAFFYREPADLTPAERAYCESKANKMERFAGRFAAKEAAMKAIGTGWSRGVGWRDFEVTRAPGGQPKSGPPTF